MGQGDGWSPWMKGGVFCTGAMSSQQPQGLGGIFSSASRAMNVGLIRGGFERMVVDKEEKYLAFLSHHNKRRCLDGGSPLPTGMESHSSSRSSSAEALSLLLRNASSTSRLAGIPRHGSLPSRVPGGGTAHDPAPGEAQLGAGKGQGTDLLLLWLVLLPTCQHAGNTWISTALQGRRALGG